MTLSRRWEMGTWNLYSNKPVLHISSPPSLFKYNKRTLVRESSSANFNIQVDTFETFHASSKRNQLTVSCRIMAAKWWLRFRGGFTTATAYQPWTIEKLFNSCIFPTYIINYIQIRYTVVHPLHLFPSRNYIRILYIMVIKERKGKKYDLER